MTKAPEFVSKNVSSTHGLYEAAPSNTSSGTRERPVYLDTSVNNTETPLQ